MRRILRLFMAAGLLPGGVLGWVGRAADEAPPADAPPPPPLRHLLIIERGATMERQLDRGADIASRLLLTGMNGRAQPGDGIGVWIAGANLETNVLPVLAWDPDPSGKLELSNRVFRELSKQESKERFSSLPDALASASTALQGTTQFVAVVIASGAVLFQGTPFDGPVNNIFSLHGPALSKAGKPFVVSLLAEAGRWTKHAVTPGDRLPHIPAPTPPPPAPVTNAAPPRTGPVVRMGEPLILTNRQRVLTVEEITAQLKVAQEREARAREAAAALAAATPESAPSPAAAAQPAAPPLTPASEPRNAAAPPVQPASNPPTTVLPPAASVTLPNPAAAPAAPAPAPMPAPTPVVQVPSNPAPAPAVAPAAPSTDSPTSTPPLGTTSGMRQMLFGALLLGVGCLLGWLLARRPGSGR